MVQVRIEDDGHVEAQVDADLADFNKFCADRLGEPLALPERAIIKTYLAWKLGIPSAK